MHYGWLYDHRTGTWNRLCEAHDRMACSRKMARIIPFAKRRTNQHVMFTEGSYPQYIPPHPDGDGIRRDV